MKKLVYFIGMAFVLSLGVYLYSCSKEEIKQTNPISEKVVDNKKPNDNQEKAGTCSCMIAGTWGACVVTCPVVHGVCGANCVRVSILWGILGYGVSCTCGSAGAGAHRYTVPEGIFYDDEHLQFLKGMERFMKLKGGFEVLDTKLLDLIAAVENGESNLVETAQIFFDELTSLSKPQAEVLAPEYQRLNALLELDVN